MTRDPIETTSPTVRPMSENRFRSKLSTGFSSQARGKVCEVCGFQGFQWQSECPKGHPLA